MIDYLKMKKQKENELIKKGEETERLINSKEWKAIVAPFIKLNEDRLVKLLREISSEKLQKIQGQLEGHIALRETLKLYIKQKNDILKRREEK